MSAWKKKSLDEEMHLKNLIGIGCDYLSGMKIGEEGHKTFTYNYIILLPRKKREYSYIYLVKGKKAPVGF